MTKTSLLLIGGIPDDNRAEVRRWSPKGVDMLFDGNMTVDALSTDSRLDVMWLVLGGSAPKRDFGLARRPDVAFNLVCDADCGRRALGMIDSVCNHLMRDGVPVLNRPERVRETTRESGPTLFAGLDRIVAPNVRRLASPRVRTVADMLNSGDLAYPTIIRTAADHNGQNMVLLSGPACMEELDRLPFDGRDYFAIPFVDFKNTDGLYRKLRLLKVGREIVPRHLIFSRSWNIHSTQRGEDQNATPDVIASEHAYLNDPQAFLGADVYTQLVTGLERTGLEFVGVDFGLLDNGDAVIFECNACTNAATRSWRPDEDPVRAEVKRRVGEAFFSCVREATLSTQATQEDQIQ